MRLIDADLLDEEIMYWSMAITGNPKSTTIINECKSSFRRMIEDQPTIDAISVVRCKDCFHWGNERMSAETEKVKLCDYYYWPMYSEKYCANGERRREL